MKIVDYAIIWRATTPALESAVKKLVAEGWQPHGGPYYAPINNTYCQAMVKFEAESYVLPSKD